MTALDLIPADIRAGYHDHAFDLLKMAYQGQGKRALESTKRCAAIHEAGHCVVNWITADHDHGGIFWPPDSARIWRAPVKGLCCWLGETLPSRNAPPLQVDARTDLAGFLTMAVRTLGGVVAEIQFDGGDFRLGSSIDEMVVAGGCARTLETVGLFPSPEEAMAALLTMAGHMLTANTHVVESIAAILERQRRIEGAELTSLLRDVRKEPGS